MSGVDPYRMAVAALAFGIIAAFLFAFILDELRRRRRERESERGEADFDAVFLRDVPTRKLADELERRSGVARTDVGAEGRALVSVEGPATVLVIGTGKRGKGGKGGL